MSAGMGVNLCWEREKERGERKGDAWKAGTNNFKHFLTTTQSRLIRPDEIPAGMRKVEIWKQRMKKTEKEHESELPLLKQDTMKGEQE